MYKDQIFAMGIILLLGVLCLFLYTDSLQYKNFARVVVEQWGDRELRLVDLCQIDYNAALIVEKNRILASIDTNSPFDLNLGNVLTPPPPGVQGG